MKRLIFATLAFLFVFSAAPASAADLSQYCRHTVGGRNIKIIGQPLDARTCTANCFRFVLTCDNGRRFTLASRYNPYEPDWINYLTQIYPLPQGLVFALVAFLVFVMRSGKQPSLAANLTYLGIVSLAMFFWPAVATSGPSEASHDLVMMAGVVSVLGFPVFVILNIKALARGWNYLFTKHAAEPIVSPALSSGSSIDTRALARTLVAGARDTQSRPVYHYENQAEKARALRDRIDAARAEVAAAERALEEVRRRAEHRQ